MARLRRNLVRRTTLCVLVGAALPWFCSAVAMGGRSSRCAEHPTNDFELVIKASKDLECLLDARFGAQGRGLHEKVSSVALPEALVRKLRFLATIRNRMIHERGFDAIPDRGAFIAAYETARAELTALLGDDAAAGPACAVS